MDSGQPSRRVKERRSAPRRHPERLVAYYWTGSVPKPKAVRDIGLRGAFIVGEDSFYPGTVVQIVFEDLAAESLSEGARPIFCVYGKVLRRAAHGFPVFFLFESGQERRKFRRFLQALTWEMPAAPEETAPAASDPVAPLAPERAKPAAASESEGQQAAAQKGSDEPSLDRAPSRGTAWQTI